MLLCQPFDSEGKKKKSLLRQLPSSAAGAGAPPGQSWQPLHTLFLPASLLPLLACPPGCRAAGAPEKGQSLAAPPLVTSEGRGRGWPPGGSPAPADEQRFLFACGSSLSRPGPDCPWGLVHACVAEILFNSSPIYLDLKRLAVIFGG